MTTNQLTLDKNGAFATPGVLFYELQFDKCDMK